MNWDELIAEFRSLGGTAENVTLRKGRFGRGLFAIDPAKQVRLHVPENLLVKTEDIELRDGHLVIKTSSKLPERERAFFEHYQREFLWGAGVFDDLWEKQRSWSQLPEAIKIKLKEMVVEDENRFSEPTNDGCFERYKKTRQIPYQSDDVIMPIIELVNHSDVSNNVYIFRNGIGVEGVVDDEVLVRYSDVDIWTRVLNAGFSSKSLLAYSLVLGIEYESYKIKLYRVFREKEKFRGVPLPRLAINGGIYQLSYLLLGSFRDPPMPRGIFLHVLRNTPIPNPNVLFDLIQHVNRTKFLELLRLLDDFDGPLVATLRSAAYYQLEALSAYWGAKPL